MLQSVQLLTETEVSETFTSISLMETLTDGQRTFGITRFPDRILQMQEADFIRKCVTQKVYVMGKQAFGDNIRVRDRSKVKAVCKIWSKHCQTEEDKQRYTFTNHTAAGNKIYQRWEGELGNFANTMIRTLINTYLPAYNEKEGVKKRHEKKLGKSIRCSC